MYIEVSRNATVSARTPMWEGFTVEGQTPAWRHAELRGAVEKHALDYVFPVKELKYRVAECGNSFALAPPKGAKLVFDRVVSAPGCFVALEDGAGMVACGMGTVSAEPRIQVWVDTVDEAVDRVTMIERLPDQSRPRAIHRAAPSRRVPDQEVELDVDGVWYLECSEQYPIALTGTGGPPLADRMVGPIMRTENAILFASYGEQLAIELIGRRLRKPTVGEILHAEGTLNLPNGVLSVFGIGGHTIATLYVHDRSAAYSVTMEEGRDGLKARVYLTPPR